LEKSESPKAPFWLRHWSSDWSSFSQGIKVQILRVHVLQTDLSIVRSLVRHYSTVFI